MRQKIAEGETSKIKNDKNILKIYWEGKNRKYLVMIKQIYDLYF